MTDLRVEDTVWQQTPEGPTEVELTEEEKHTGALILPRLLELYDKWLRDDEDAIKRGRYPKSFSEFALNQPVCRYAYELPVDTYDPGVIYAAYATERPYFVSDFQITLTTRNNHLVVESVDDRWSM